MMLTNFITLCLYCIVLITEISRSSCFVDNKESDTTTNISSNLRRSPFVYKLEISPRSSENKTRTWSIVITEPNSTDTRTSQDLKNKESLRQMLKEELKKLIDSMSMSDLKPDGTNKTEEKVVVNVTRTSADEKLSKTKKKLNGKDKKIKYFLHEKSKRSPRSIPFPLSTPETCSSSTCPKIVVAQPKLEVSVVNPPGNGFTQQQLFSALLRFWPTLQSLIINNQLTFPTLVRYLMANLQMVSTGQPSLISSELMNSDSFYNPISYVLNRFGCRSSQCCSASGSVSTSSRPLPTPNKVTAPREIVRTVIVNRPIAIPRLIPVWLTRYMPIRQPVYISVPTPSGTGRKPVPYPVKTPYPVLIVKNVVVPKPVPVPVPVKVPRPFPVWVGSRYQTPNVVVRPVPVVKPHCISVPQYLYKILSVRVPWIVPLLCARPRPVPVPFPVSYPVPINRVQPVAVPRPYPVPVPVPVPVCNPWICRQPLARGVQRVVVNRPIPIPVPTPVPVPVPLIKPVPYPVPQVVKAIFHRPPLVVGVKQPPRYLPCFIRVPQLIPVPNGVAAPSFKRHHHHHPVFVPRLVHVRVGYPVPKPVYVPFFKVVPRIIYRPYPIPRPFPVPVTSDRFIPQAVPVAAPYPVNRVFNRPVPIPVPVRVPYPFVVPLYKKSPVPVPTPVPVPYPVTRYVPNYITLPKPVPIVITKPIPVPIVKYLPVYIHSSTSYPRPQLFPVPVVQKIPYAVLQILKIKEPVPVPKPYPVKVVVPLPYPVVQLRSYPVPKLVVVPKIIYKWLPRPYPVLQPSVVPQPYPYPVVKHIPVPRLVYLIKRMLAIQRVPVPVPYPVPQVVPQTIVKRWVISRPYPVPSPVPVTVYRPQYLPAPVPISRPYPIYIPTHHHHPQVVPHARSPVVACRLLPNHLHPQIGSPNNYRYLIWINRLLEDNSNLARQLQNLWQKVYSIPESVLRELRLKQKWPQSDSYLRPVKPSNYPSMWLQPMPSSYPLRFQTLVNGLRYPCCIPPRPVLLPIIIPKFIFVKKLVPIPSPYPAPVRIPTPVLVTRTTPFQVPVRITRPVSYPIAVPSAVSVPTPFAVARRVPVPILIPVRSQVSVPKPFPVPFVVSKPVIIQNWIPVPTPVFVSQRIPIPVPVPVSNNRNFSKPILFPVPVPYTRPVAVPKLVPFVKPVRVATPVAVPIRVPAISKITVPKPYPVFIPIQAPRPVPLIKTAIVSRPVSIPRLFYIPRPISVPRPVPVQFPASKPIVIPVPVPRPVAVPRPFIITRPISVPGPVVSRLVPFPIPVPLKIPVPVPRPVIAPTPVAVPRLVGVYLPTPGPVLTQRIPVPVPVPLTRFVFVPKPVPVSPSAFIRGQIPVSVLLPTAVSSSPLVPESLTQPTASVIPVERIPTTADSKTIMPPNLEAIYRLLTVLLNHPCRYVPCAGRQVTIHKFIPVPVPVQVPVPTPAPPAVLTQKTVFVPKIITIPFPVPKYTPVPTPIPIPVTNQVTVFKPVPVPTPVYITRPILLPSVLAVQSPIPVQSCSTPSAWYQRYVSQAVPALGPGSQSAIGSTSYYPTVYGNIQPGAYGTVPLDNWYARQPVFGKTIYSPVSAVSSPLVISPEQISLKTVGISDPRFFNLGHLFGLGRLPGILKNSKYTLIPSYNSRVGVPPGTVALGEKYFIPSSGALVKWFPPLQLGTSPNAQGFISAPYSNWYSRFGSGSAPTNTVSSTGSLVPLGTPLSNWLARFGEGNSPTTISVSVKKISDRQLNFPAREVVSSGGSVPKWYSRFGLGTSTFYPTVSVYNPPPTKQYTTLETPAGQITLPALERVVEATLPGTLYPPVPVPQSFPWWRQSSIINLLNRMNVNIPYFTLLPSPRPSIFYIDGKMFICEALTSGDVAILSAHNCQQTAALNGLQRLGETTTVMQQQLLDSIKRDVLVIKRLESLARLLDGHFQSNDLGMEQDVLVNQRISSILQEPARILNSWRQTNPVLYQRILTTVDPSSSRLQMEQQ